MEKIKAGVIGYGQRGRSMLSLLLKMPEKVEVVAVCDLYEDRAEDARKKVLDRSGKDCISTTNADELINNPDINTIYIFAAWEAHIPLSIAAMKAGKAVACEVAGAYSVEQCWDLVKTYEETKTPIMMLENCCYGKREMMIQNMHDSGFFGEIVHVDGAYCHDLRGEISDGIKIRHYRLRNYLNRNCENYPTHEIGPIAQLLGINRGNRFLSLASFSSKSRGLEEFIKTERADEAEIQGLRFNQGDIVTTVIKCAGGQTITLALSTTLPRFYSRNYNVYGTKAFAHADTKSICESANETHRKEAEMGDWSKEWGNEKNYEEQWMHPVWKKYIEEGLVAGHGGMDWLVLNAFADSLLENKPMPIDVYDMATWMVITALSEDSIAKGGQVVEFPDFTNGKWLFNSIG